MGFLAEHYSVDAKEVKQMIYKTVFGAKPRDGKPLLWSAAAKSHQLSAELMDVPRYSHFVNARSNRPNPAAS